MIRAGLKNDLAPVKVELGQRDAANDYFKLGGSLHGSISGTVTGNSLFDLNDIESFWRSIGVPMPTQSQCNDLLPGPPDAMPLSTTPLVHGAGIKQLTQMELRSGIHLPLPPEWSQVTTVMMRNLPNKYTQRMLITEVNQNGFLGTFDFFYLPIDQETTANRGYGFLNFIAPYYAWAFHNMFEGRRMSRFNSAKVVSVTPATLQGFQANYMHYSSARVNRGDPSARPLFLREPSSKLSGGGLATDIQDVKDKGNSKRARRKGKLQAADASNPPQARLDEKTIDAGNYQHSETTTTAQDSQESQESQESQSSHSDSQDAQDAQENPMPVKSRQQSRKNHEQQQKQPRQQQQQHKQQQRQQRKEDWQQNQKQQRQQNQQQKQWQDQHRKADPAPDAEPYFIDLNGGSNGLFNCSGYSTLGRSLGGLNGIGGYPASLDPGMLGGSFGLNNSVLSSLPNTSNQGLSPVYCRSPTATNDVINVMVGPNGNNTNSAPNASEKPQPRFCPHCAGCIKPQFQFCPHCGNGLAFLGQN